ncbi:MAG: hypothetical protein M3Q69_07320 [Acidobacteriota bacterium]|nr:hypothetical protein [Acidobacteriota bacterium]
MAEGTLADEARLARGLRVIWLLSLLFWLSPLYFDGTRSFIATASGVPTHDNQWLSVAATTIIIPLVYAWKKGGPRVGATVDLVLLGAVLMWLAWRDPGPIRRWWSAAGKSAAACAAFAAAISLLSWAQFRNRAKRNR